MNNLKVVLFLLSLVVQHIDSAIAMQEPVPEEGKKTQYLVQASPQVPVEGEAAAALVSVPPPAAWEADSVIGLVRLELLNVNYVSTHPLVRPALRDDEGREAAASVPAASSSVSQREEDRRFLSSILPVEIWHRIFAFLDPRSLGIFTKTYVSMYRVAKSFPRTLYVNGSPRQDMCRLPTDQVFSGLVCHQIVPCYKILQKLAETRNINPGEGRSPFSQIHRFTCKNCVVTDGRTLASVLAFLPELRCLDLGQIRVKDSLLPLASVFANMRRLRTLKISMTSLPCEKSFLSALCQPTGLTVLNLEHTALGLQGIRFLALSLPSLSTLTVLTLKGNSIGNEGIQVLAPVLPQLPLLGTLDLSSNLIRNEGVCSIIPFLKEPRRLRVLNLSFNDLGFDEVRDFLPSFPRSLQLIIWSSSFTSVPSQRLEALREAFPHLTLFSRLQ